MISSSISVALVSPVTVKTKNKNVDNLQNLKNNDLHDKNDLSPRIIELRKKIQSEEYLNSAVMRIAQVMSNMLMERETSEELKLQD